MRRRLRWLVVGSVGATTLLWLIAGYGPEDWLWVALLRYGPPSLPLAPLLFALPLLLWTRAYRASGLFAVLLVLGGALSYSPRWSALRPAAEDHGSWTLLAWNVEKYDRGAEGVAQQIHAIDADVVCLTEAGTYFWHTEEAHRPGLLDARMNGYERVVADEIRVYSRLPILSSRILPLAHGEPGRPLLDVEIATPTPVHVLCMHAPPTYAAEHLRGRARGSWSAWARTRREHVHEVGEHVPTRAPWVLAGDFNCPDRCALWRETTPHDAWLDVGRGFGATESTGQRVDRITSSASMQSTRIVVVRTHASDHDALVATFPR